MNRRILAAAVVAVMVTGCSDPEPAERAVEVEEKKPQVKLAAAPDAGAPVASAPGSAKAVEPEPPPRRDRGIGFEHEDGRFIDHLARARTLHEAGELAGALAEARRAVFDDPSDATALEATARLARQTGERDLAKQALTMLAEIAPSDALPVMRLARLLVTEGDAEKALAAADEATLRDPGLAEAWHLRGRASLQLGRLAAALKDFRKATLLDPEHGYAFNNLGYTLLLAGRSAEAIEPLERAAVLLPHVAFVHNNLGIAYEREQMDGEARKAYSRALDLDPKYVKALVNSARLTQLASAGAITIDAMPSFEPDPDIDLPVPAAPSIPTWGGPPSDAILPTGLDIEFLDDPDEGAGAETH